MKQSLEQYIIFYDKNQGDIFFCSRKQRLLRKKSKHNTESNTPEILRN